MELNAVYILWLREIKRFTRSKSRIVGNVSMPVIWLVVLGIGLNSSFSVPGMEFDYLAFMAPGIIGMALLFTSIFSGVSVIWDKQFGFLKEILVAPVSRTSIVLGKIAGSSTISLFNGLIILGLGIAIGAIPLSALSPFPLAAALLFMVLISFSFVSIGLVIASRLNNMEGFQMIMSFLVMPVFFLSGAFFPMKNVPFWMKGLAFLDPLFYGVDGLRASLVGASDLPLLLDLAILAVFCALMVLFSAFMFRKVGE